MKLAFLIVALTLALIPSAPAQPATLAAAAGTIAAATADTAAPAEGSDAVDPTSTRRRNNDTPETSAVPGPSTYLLLALGLFGMGLVSRRRRAD